MSPLSIIIGTLGIYLLVKGRIPVYAGLLSAKAKAGDGASK